MNYELAAGFVKSILEQVDGITEIKVTESRNIFEDGNWHYDVLIEENSVSLESFKRLMEIVEEAEENLEDTKFDVELDFHRNNIRIFQVPQEPSKEASG